MRRGDRSTRSLRQSTGEEVMCFFEFLKQMIMQQSKLCIVLFSLALTTGVMGTTDSYAVYDVPPQRRITCSAGLDPVGGSPNYTNVTCTGIVPTCGEDNSGNNNTCLLNTVGVTAVFN